MEAVAFPPPLAECLVPADHVHDAITRALIAERELDATRRRAAQLARANQLAATPACIVLPPDPVADLLAAASAIESAGGVPLVRFARDGYGVIVGLELAILTAEAVVA